MNTFIKITNLPLNYNEEEIHSNFLSIGQINEIKYGKTEVIVEYADEDAAKNSMILNSIIIDNKKIEIECGN